MIKEYFNDLYLKLLFRPKPKFKKGDIVELNDDGRNIGIIINKPLIVSHTFWFMGNYIVLFKNCFIHESICENWLKLKEEERL